MQYEALVNRVASLRDAMQADVITEPATGWQLGFAAAIRDVLIVLEQENNLCKHQSLS